VASAAEPLGASLESWLSLLDDEGFRVGIRERLLVQNLAAQFIASGDLPKEKPLEALLRITTPLLCSNPEQQTRYAGLMAAFLDRGGNGQLPPDKGRTRLKRLLPWLAATCLLIAGITAVDHFRSNSSAPERAAVLPPPPPFTGDKPPGGTPVPSGREVYVAASHLPVRIHAPPVWIKPARISLIVLGALCLGGLTYFAWSQWRRQLYLQNVHTDEEVKERFLTDPHPISAEPPAGYIRRVAVGLRQRYAGTGEILDVEATVRATMSANGALTPRFKTTRRTPEYLVLIDQRHPLDHLVAYSKALVTALERVGIAVVVQYFEGSPQNGCWRVRAGSQNLRHVGLSSFAELAARFEGDRLLVFGDTRVLDSDSGAPRPWLSQLNSFPQRAWITPMPLPSWGRLEQRADALGFLVLPAHTESLSTLASWFSAGQLGLQIAADWPGAYPSLLQDGSAAWVARQISPPPDVLDELLFQLRVYLGAKRFQWLCACAIMPAVSPPVTLSMGRQVGADDRELTLGLAAMSALPWFRHGFMPAWLRVALLNRLDKHEELRLREVVQERLATAIESTATPPILTIGERQRRLRAWFHRGLGVARDWIMVDFLHRGSSLRLSHRLPEGLRKLLWRDGVSAYGFRREFVLVLACGFLLSFVSLPGIWERVAPTAVGPPLDMISTFPVQSGVTAIAASPDGRRFLSGHQDGSLRLWDGARGLGIFSAVSSGAPIVSTAFDADGSLILSATPNSELVASDAETGRVVSTLEQMGPLDSVTISPDGRRVVARTSRAQWQLLSVQPIEFPHSVAKLPDDLSNTVQVAFSSDGTRFAAVTNRGMLKIWEAKLVATAGGSLPAASGVTSLALNSDGSQLVSGHVDGYLRFWDLGTQSAIGPPIKSNGKEVTAVAFSPDDSYVASGTSNGTLQLWDSKSHQPVGAPLRESGSRITSIAFSPDGGRLLEGSKQNGDLRMWGRPATAALDLFVCATSFGLTNQDEGFANRIADAVQRGTLPTVTPIIYQTTSRTFSASIRPLRFGIVYFAAERDRAAAQQLAHWLSQTVSGKPVDQPTQWETEQSSSSETSVFLANLCVTPADSGQQASAASPPEVTAPPTKTKPPPAAPGKDRSSSKPSRVSPAPVNRAQPEVPTAPPPSAAIESYLQQANEAVSHGPTDGLALAKVMYQKVLEMSDQASRADVAKAYLGLGIVSMKQGDYAPATEYLKRSIEADPEPAAAYLNLGDVLQAQGNYSEAILNYEAAIKRDPNSTAPYCRMVSALSRANRPDEAAKVSAECWSHRKTN
jgi:TolA-binding protein